MTRIDIVEVGPRDGFQNLDIYLPLVSNLYGARVAYELGIRKVSYVVSLSESHNKANINRSHEDSLNKLKNIMDNYKGSIYLRRFGGCPFAPGAFGNAAIEDLV